MITIIAGTNRKQSMTKKVALFYQTQLAERGLQSSIIDLALLPEDFAFSALYENNGKNAVFNAFREQIATFDKILFVVPEYNGSFPGVLKTFIDGLSYPDALKGRKTALVGVSAGATGGVWALSHLTDILHYLNAEVLSTKVRLNNIKANFVDGAFTNPLYQDLVKQQLDKFITF